MNKEKRKFILAEPDEELRAMVLEEVAAVCPQNLIAQAADGADATFKISNDNPHVLWVRADLAKVNGVGLLNWLFSEQHNKSVACVLSGADESELFADQMATGQLQILPKAFNKKMLKEILQKALSYSAAQSQTEWKVKSVPANDVLIREGDLAESVYLIKKGSLMAYTQKNGKEIELGRIAAGEFVGEMAYISGEPRSASVRTLETCELVEIPVHLLDHVLFTKPVWVKALLRTLSNRVKAGNFGKLG